MQARAAAAARTSVAEVAGDVALRSRQRDLVDPRIDLLELVIVLWGGGGGRGGASTSNASNAGGGGATTAGDSPRDAHSATTHAYQATD